MRKTKRKFAAMVLCVLSLTVSAFPQMNVYAASASIEYTGGIGLTDIVQQLNQQLGIDSMVENWTFYTTGNATIKCHSFMMQYVDGNNYNMMNYIGLYPESTDAYQIYSGYMEDFRRQESTGYFPINGNKQSIPTRTVDMGDVYYNIQTPFPVEGTSHTVITYSGSVEWTGFLDCIGAGVSVSMQCRGINYTVDFIASTSGNTSTDHNSGTDTNIPEDNNSGGNNTGEDNNASGESNIGENSTPSSGGTTGGNSIVGDNTGGSSGSVQGENNSGGSSSDPNQNSSNGQSGNSYQAKMYDSKKSPQEQPNAIVPGRSSLNSESLLRLTASTASVPTIETVKEPEKSEIAESDDIKISDSSVEDTDYTMAFKESTDQKWLIYSVDSTLDQQAENAGKIFQYAMLGVAGAGLLRLLFLFGKMKRGA